MYIFRRRLVVVWCLYWCFLAFSSTISQVFTIFLWLPYLLMLYLFILLSQPCQNWLILHTPSKLYEERWICSQRAYQTVFLNLHPVVVTVVITLSLSFLLPQHKVRLKKNTLSRGSPYILFQPSHLHFY